MKCAHGTMKNLICPTDTGCPALFLQMCVSVCLNDGTVMCETIKRPNKCVIRESLKCIRATETWKEWEKKREDTINQFDRWVNSGNNVKGKEKRRQQQRRWRQRKYHSVIKKSEKLHFGYFIQANTFFDLAIHLLIFSLLFCCTETAKNVLILPGLFFVRNIKNHWITKKPIFILFTLLQSYHLQQYILEILFRKGKRWYWTRSVAAAY